VGNCGNNETYEWYIRAQVKIVTPTSEDSFSFDERCNIFSTESDQDIQWVIEASDMSVPFFGIAIGWEESFISGPGTFQVDEGDSNLVPVIGREHHTKLGWIRYYFVDEGIITFTQVGYQSGDIIEGTFDQFRVYDLGLEENIEVDNGTFRCRVE
jgi:hypothetical protein